VDVFDQQSQQLLFLRGEAVTFGFQVAEACGDFAGAAVQLGHVDESGLVEVGQSAAFGGGGVDLAVKAAEFGGE